LIYTLRNYLVNLLKSPKIKVPTILLALALVLFLVQLSSLFVFPLPNSLRWFGDETWLMSEAKSQISMGIVRYPLAVGSTLEHSKGVVLSLTWLSSLLYGLPAALINADPVIIGRIVTAALSLILSITLYLCARRLGANRLSASVAVLLLISSRTFFFASHSCRPDVLASFVVIGFVATCTLLSRNVTERSRLWWFSFGATVTFLAITSSIHLLTLVVPASIFFVWRLNVQKQLRHWVEFATGAAVMLGILVFVYYVTTGSLTLFAPASGRVQFNDVLSSIPILRPFSRSVQTANIIIRIKQFIAEAPQLYLLLLALPVLLNTNWRKENRHTFTIASLIVFLSWLLLQGAEITYLIHILPLLALGLALATTKILEYGKYQLAIKTLLIVTAVASFIYGLHDALEAKVHAEIIDHSNESAVANISHAIARTWGYPGIPRVVTEPPALDRLSMIASVQTITDHFISFPLNQESLDSFFISEHINYVVLYNSPTYPKDRPLTDSFYQGVCKSATLVDEEIGMTGDAGRSYFHDSPWRDTLLLFKLNAKQ
jgi:hypothetical protein